MGWSFFTAPLAAGQRLTSAMRYELYAALGERNAALPNPVTLDAGANAAILASKWESDLVSVGGSLMSWAQAVYAVAGAGYIDASLVGSSLWGGAAPDPFAGVDPTIIATRYNDTRYWNAVRAAIIGLTCIRIDLLLSGGTTAYTATLGGPFTTAALAAADLVGATLTPAIVTEALAQILGFNGVGSYRFSSSIFTVGTAAIPALACFSGGYTLLVGIKANGSNSVTPNLSFEWEGTPATLLAPAANAYASLALAGSATGPAVDWAWTLPDQLNATALAADFGAAGNQDAGGLVLMAGGDECAVGVLPGFAYV